MKKLLIILLLQITSVSFSQSIDSTLLKAYKYKSKIILDEFFMNWKASDTVNKPDSGNLSDTVKAIYDIVNEFYGSIVNTSDKNMQYYSPISGKYKYFVLKTSIWYEIVDSVKNYSDIFDIRFTPKLISRGYLTNFRPIQNLGNSECLYLNDIYLNSLITLFKNKNAYSSMESEEFEQAEKIYNRKVDFLNGYVKIIQKGNILIPELNIGSLLSDPVLDEITINEKLNQANLYFSIECAGYVAKFVKKNGKWVEISRKPLITC